MDTTVKDFDPRILFEHEPRVWLRRSGNRETFLWNGGSGLDCVVKRTRGDVASDRWRERWIRDHAGGPFAIGRVRSPGRREHDNLVRLADEGFRVPRAISWCEERAGRFGSVARSLVVMERVAHHESVRERLARMTSRSLERRALLQRVVDLVARFHEHGWYHRDMYLQHVLLRANDDALVLIDVGRARHVHGPKRSDRAPRRRWLVKDLAAVLHSCPACVTRRERLELCARWLDRMGIVERSARRRFIAAVERKRARMEAHVPRDERATAGVP